MSPTLSVITITKDDPLGLSETTRSLNSLRGAPFFEEHIVVDGSRSPTSPPCFPDWPLRHVASPPRGIYAAMNEGILRASADVLWFLNGGDRLKDPIALQKLMGRFSTDPDLDLICAAADLVADGRLTFVSYPRKTLRRSLLSGRPLCHQAMLFRRRVFMELGPYAEQFSLAGDEELVLRLFLANRKTHCVPDRLVLFDTGGVSGRFGGERYGELARAGALLRGRLPRLAYCRYVFNQRWNSARAACFRRLRRLPGGEDLRLVWLGWRRLTLRYR